MKPITMTHVAICVLPNELQEAERFYRDLFGMGAAFYEAITPSGWATIPEGVDPWDYAARHDLSIGLIMIYRDQFAIDLEARTFPTGGSRFSHVGLEVEAGELSAVRKRGAAARCEFTFDSDEIVVFNDVFGMRWEFTTLPYGDPQGLSAGRRLGHWHQPAAELAGYV
jgi:catechol 2,3-dioxygenase-like lactoylglutathione lyase family enzyme